MSQELSYQGYILKTQDLGEADLLLTFFAADEGKMRFLVKSAKKLTSRLSGRLQPTALIEVTLAGQSSLAKLIGAQILNNHPALLESQAQMTAVLVIQEFTNRALPDHQPNSELFEAYTEALGAFEQATAQTIVVEVDKFLVKGLSAIGLAPRLLDQASNGAGIFFSLSEGRFTLTPSAVDDLKISQAEYLLYQDLLLDKDIDPISSTSAVMLLKLLNDFTAYQLERPMLAVQNFINLAS